MHVLSSMLSGVVKALLLFLLFNMVEYLSHGYLDDSMLRMNGSMAVVWFLALGILLPYLHRKDQVSHANSGAIPEKTPHDTE